MKSEKIKFKWENDFECNYRYSIEEISSKVSYVLGELGKYAKQKDPNYSIPLHEIIPQYNILLKMSVPCDYKESHKLVIYGFEYYIKSLKLLANVIESKSKDINEIKKAATFIEVGNAYIRIVSCKNCEYFEMKETEYNESQN